MKPVRVGITVHVAEVIAREGKPESFFQVGTRYAQTVAQAGGIPLLLPTSFTAAGQTEAVLDSIDALLVSGGGNIPGQYFLDNPDPTLRDTNPVRYDLEVELIRAASQDPQVLAIKQTLYRTSGDSPIVDSLIDAAEAGKQVLAIVEIKARFDEQANISWARKLEEAGVHVVYGIVGLKTHCKLSLVVRSEKDGLHRYCHIGTGNYHPKTARGYEDLGLMTCDPDVGQDLTRLFNQLSGYAPRSRFRRLLVAPRSMRSGVDWRSTMLDVTEQLSLLVGQITCPASITSSPRQEPV